MSKKTAVVLFTLLVLSSTAAAAFYQVSFKGMKLDSTTVTAGETLDVTANIANLKEGPYTDLSVVAILSREVGNSQVLRTTLKDDVDLAGRELETLDTEIQVPDDAIAGDHRLILVAFAPSGAPVSVISKDITVESSIEAPVVKFGKGGTYIEAEKIVTGNNSVMRFELPSYGSEGENVLPDTTFDITFDLINPRDTSTDLAATIDIYPTYGADRTPVASMTRDLGTLQAGAQETYSISHSLSEPGTYVVEVGITADGEQVAENDVRLVIAGGAGSIIDLNNEQDTYDSGEDVDVTTSIVGPADGSTTVEDAYLRLSIMKDGSTVTSTEKTVEKLPLSPEERTFNVDAPEELSEYTLKATLGKDDRVYDTYAAVYEPLTAEQTFTDSGQVQEEGQCLDDGVCTPQEYDIGTCYDCRNVDERPGTTQKVDDETGSDGQQDKGSLPLAPAALGVVAVIAIVGGLFYMRQQA